MSLLSSFLRSRRQPGAGDSLQSVVLLAIAAVLVTFHTVPARAQFGQPAPEPGIFVEGTGQVKSVPDVVEINLRLSAKGELTDDAVVKHRDSKKRAIETFEALKLENLELEEKNLSLRAGGNAQEMMNMMWGGMPPSANKRTQVEVGSVLRARLKNIDKMPLDELMTAVGKLLDAAQDSGFSLGMSDSDLMMMRYYGWGRQQSSLVKFIVSNAKEAKEKAYELAVADAKKRAERLARLSNIKLGNVLSIDELGNNMNRYFYYYPMDTGEDQESKDEIIAETLSGGTLKITLRVKFAILSTPGEAVSQTTPSEGKK